jgi:hypothetical protein
MIRKSHVITEAGLLKLTGKLLSKKGVLGQGWRNKLNEGHDWQHPKVRSVLEKRLTDFIFDTRRTPNSILSHTANKSTLLSLLQSQRDLLSNPNYAERQRLMKELVRQKVVGSARGEKAITRLQNYNLTAKRMQERFAELKQFVWSIRKKIKDSSLSSREEYVAKNLLGVLGDSVGSQRMFAENLARITQELIDESGGK